MVWFRHWLAVFRPLHLAVALALSCLVTLTGCSLDQFKTEAAQVSQLVFATPSNPATFNYPLNSSAFSVFSFIYEGLIEENGLTAELEPALAESWSISPDKRRITFTLREGLKWSDGEPLTADDVVFSYNEIYLNEKIPTGIRDILRIGSTGAFPSVKKLDSRRVEFTVPEPFAPFLRYTGGIPILPAHALRQSVYSTDTNGNPKFLSTWGTDTDPKKNDWQRSLPDGKLHSFSASGLPAQSLLLAQGCPGESPALYRAHCLANYRIHRQPVDRISLWRDGQSGSDT